MTTPNGHEATDLEAGGEHASSTVLALDGWGPVVPEPAANGANGSNGVEPDVMGHHEPEPATVSTTDGRDRLDSWRERLERTIPRSVTELPIDSQLVTILASAAAMSIAVFAVILLGRRLMTLDLQASASFADSAGLRRRLALAIDPSLTPAPVRPSRPSILSRLLEL
ncbi:MAG: hypothetical protein F4066_07980 [Chloroflexi bacterium]|nr:hypothetical protein [Chloroflexota bacterium]MYF80383.1 hypothetical protein [Chloroflexota bacterium]MYI04785.1 hypothetical protein [Chloroflexota bacterium]